MMDRKCHRRAKTRNRLLSSERARSFRGDVLVVEDNPLTASAIERGN
jgi:hypothetical protein